MEETLSLIHSFSLQHDTHTHKTNTHTHTHTHTLTHKIILALTPKYVSTPYELNWTLWINLEPMFDA